MSIFIAQNKIDRLCILDKNNERNAVQDLFGKYVHERPRGRNWLGQMKNGVEEFSFGVFGRCKQAEAALRTRWAGAPLQGCF